MKTPRVTVAEAMPPPPEKPAEGEIPQPAIPDVVEEPGLEPYGLNSDEPVAKINLDGLRSANSGSTHKVSPSLTAIYGKAANANTNVTGIMHQTQKSHTRNSGSDDTLEVIFKLVLVVALAYGGWWGYKNYYKPQLPPIAINLPKDPVIKTDIASKAPPEVKVSVNSSPDNAEIVVGDVVKDSKTPAVITLPANKEIDIIIRKNGYLDYKVTRKFTEPTEQLSVTMQASQTTGYLNIRVTDGNSFTKISINGKELLEKAPILKYPIVAQKETIITAYNPISKLKHEKTVSVNTGESLDVLLTLEQTKPPNQK